MTWKDTRLLLQTGTDYSRRNIINQGTQGCWICDIVHWISHQKLVLRVSDNTSKLQKMLVVVTCESQPPHLWYSVVFIIINRVHREEGHPLFRFVIGIF